jgi:hypothetical protein
VVNEDISICTTDERNGGGGKEVTRRMKPGGGKERKKRGEREKNAPKFAECDNNPDPSHKRVAGYQHRRRIR